jgi:LPXTG-motif cell wall-anchored protein
MRSIGMILAAAAALILTAVPALAQESVSNPCTGDNSMVGLALAVMGVAAVVIVVLLFVTRKKK